MITRKQYKDKLAFLRILNWTERCFLNNHSLRFNLEKAHAKIMYITHNDLAKLKTPHIILHKSDHAFYQKYKIWLKDLINKYPITPETRAVWTTISEMNNEQFQNYFGISREDLSKIYPTTKEELTTIHHISTLSDEEVKTRYGIIRQELLQKYPLNNDTLKAIRSINDTKNETVEKIFNKSKEEVLHLRTITTEMIKTANKNIRLKRSTYTKEELLEMLKSKKKGTFLNG